MNREEHTGLKNFVYLVFLIVLLIGVYYIYRLSKNPSQAQLHNIQDIAALPASKCTVSSGSFLGASGGNIYIGKGQIRQDVLVIEGGEQQMVHQLMTGDNNGTLYTWFEGRTDGFSITNIYATGGFNVAQGRVTCNPWWIVNNNAFVLPADVTFAPAQ